MKAILDLIFKKEPLLSTAVMTAIVAALVNHGILPPEFQSQDIVNAIIAIVGVFVARKQVTSPATVEKLKAGGD